MTEIKIISGQTWHGRRGRVENDFKYSIDYLLFDPEKLEMSPWLLSKKGGFFYGINPLDYGGLNDLGAPKKWVLEVLKARKITCFSKVLLLAQPRILGHIFNPVSFWLCFDEADKLVVVVAEVSNTFGDRHSYLCCNDDLKPIRPEHRIKATKIFHVIDLRLLSATFICAFFFDCPDSVNLFPLKTT